MVAMKFYDYELMTPSLRQILKYFKVGKMNLSSKDDSIDSEKIRDIQEIVFETVYEYICERQMDLMFRVDWKMPMITIKHFVDHFRQILPEFDKEDEKGTIQITKFSKYFTLDQSMQTELTTTSMKEFFKACRAEILE